MVTNDRSNRSTPSYNWLALQKTIKKAKSARESTKSSVSAFVARKRRKLDHIAESPAPPTPNGAAGTGFPPTAEHAFPRGPSREEETIPPVVEDVKGGESLSALRKMVMGEVEITESHKQPGKYLALDCEMVGVGIDGAESVLARVSLVNFYGFVLLDAIVRPRERVVDYRTEFSGIRPSDMVHARPFEEVQKEVADLLKDRILVGHAVHNDLKALLLSHSRPQTRDTQILAYKHKLARGRRPALRHLVQQELGLTIQGGEHSSVTDARATMALFRIHRKTWEKPLSRKKSSANQPHASTSATPHRSDSTKRPRASSLSEPADDVDSEGDGGDGADATSVTVVHSSAATAPKKKKVKTRTQDSFPGGGRRGVSSGLSTVVKRGGVSGRGMAGQGKMKAKATPKEKWWKELGGGGAGSKGSVRLKVG